MSGTERRSGSGLTRQRRRLSEEEVEQAMMRAAIAMVDESGLTVSLDHIGFVDVIQAAGVPRTAVYRRWPSKDEFVADLLKELAKGASPAVAGGNPEALAATRRVILDRLDWLRRPETRTALIAEVLRQGAAKELQALHRSAGWRTYIALHATFLSLPPDGDLRRAVQQGLIASERALTGQLADAYRSYTQLLGCRLRPELGATFEDLARLVNAAMRGLVVMLPAGPELAERTLHADPFGTDTVDEWSQPALAMASIAMTFIEADPDAEFDEERIASVREALRAARSPR
ncbi:TetR/AcrR family transcriptional regulator [Streptomyces sp. PTD5-9]|uniref:TetR/AcrR family transcriptional regulator n=1 Tax=Streptomyces sp. PTD5-9 TaxID=3120150 RepID=UPI003008CF9E